MIGIRLVSDIVPYWAAQAPERIALVEPRRTWSYRQLDEAIAVTITWLAQSGIRPGDRVMLVCENCCAAVSIYLGCTALGAWPVVVNARLSDREIDENRAHSSARRVILTTSVSLRAKAHAERMGAEMHDPAGFGAVAMSPLDEAAAPEPRNVDHAKNVAALIYTSGTTGEAKGVMLSHGNLMFVAKASARARALSADDGVYAILPISHILGLTGVLLGALVSGARVHLASRFDPASVLSALANDGVSVMIGTPSMYTLLGEYAGRKDLTPIPAPALRLISSAGAPLDAATKAGAETAFGRTLHNGYGITECSPTISLTALDAPRSDCAVGRLLPGIETCLAGASESDPVGELYIRSPGVMQGYYKASELTAQVVDEEGWFRTGDLARIEDGNLFIVGRCKEMIIRFGFNVYPAEVEGVLNAHPAIACSAVIGRSRDGSEDILAFVQAAPGMALSSDEIADYAAAKLVAYKRPTEIRIVDAMPMSPTGKILKSALAA